MTVLVEQARAAVAALNVAVAEQGFDAAVTDGELHDATIALQKTKSALGVAGARVLDRWDGRRVWMPGGHLSAASRLSHDAKLARGTAKRELYRARRLDLMPLATAAVVEGLL